MCKVADLYLLPCFYKQCFGISCPFCGFQRSVLALFQGHILGSIKLFPPLFPLIFLIGITIIVGSKKKTFNVPTLKYCWLVMFCILIANGVYQNVLQIF